MTGIAPIMMTLMLISLMLSVIFFLSWSSFGRKPHALAWSATFGLATFQWLGNLLHVTTGFFPNFLTYWLIVSGLAYVVSSLGFAGYLLRAGYKVRIKWFVAAVLVAEALTLWTALPGGHQGVSSAISPVFTCICVIGAVWALYTGREKKNGAEWAAITVNSLFLLTQMALVIIALLMGPDRDPEMARLFSLVLFLTLPTAFTGLGLFMVTVLAADLAEQVAEFAEKEKEQLSAKADQYWETLQDVIGTIPELVSIEDGTGKIMACNDQFASLLGLEKHQLVGRRVVDYFEENADLFRSVDGQLVDETGIQMPRAMWRALETGNPLTVQMADERIFMVDCAAIHTGGNILVAHDVTDIRRVTLQLEDAIASMPLAFALFDENDGLVACNQGMEDLCGGAPEDKSSASLSMLLEKLGDLLRSVDGKPLSPTDSWQKEGAILEAAIKSDASFLCEFKDGRWFQISSRGAGSGGCVLIAHDLTEYRKLEQEIEGQREALFQSEKLNALGTLLAGVAHELNNPLTIVVANAHVLSMVSDNPELTERVEKITGAAERCSKIVHAFLAMARKGQGTMRPCDFGACIDNALNISGFGFRQYGIDVVCNVAPDLPEIQGDADQLSQAVFNLLLNAQQVMADMEGPRRISIDCRFDVASQKIILKVADNGPGVPADIEAKVFDPFFTTKEVGKGTGLGLFLVRGMISSHGGTVELEKAKQQGAHFRITLPVTSPKSQEIDTSMPGGLAEVMPQKILVVDDEPNILTVLSDILKHQGHAVFTETSGEAALRCIELETVDVMITDLRMQGMSGGALYQAVEEQTPALAKQTVIMTGDNLSKEAAAFLERFGGPVLSKPFSPEDVAAVLAKLLK